MDDVTRLPDDASVGRTGLGTVASRDLTPSGASWGRFEPGTIFAGRFRIVASLGKGGMGEVYRADDLKLGQTVALKLLPDDLAGHPGRLAQFHNEVRIARTISHRNVCRTYDIGDADGIPFLTMEYVDGEDLSSLLRRIGRFPQDKAIEVARQICAGIAAAHARGVLHRDLKPANVMIDGEGHVRITDFGLAAIAGTVEDIRTGTPAYMAPEQLAGRDVSERSDIYSLGLVLFELFTGKRVFEASSLQDLLRLHESDSVKMPSSLIRDLDPAIERAILRCLERNPAKRPPSALAVSAALPGGDQLAAALAAGETPSPEMVAAAGEQSALRPGIGLGLVAFTLVMLGVLVTISERLATMTAIPLPRSTDSLTDRAKDLLQQIGYAEEPGDAMHGWVFRRDFFVWNGRDRTLNDARRTLATGRTNTLNFWYRTSPAPIVSSPNSFLPSTSDPPFILSGMRLAFFDPHGRLTEFHAIPPQIEGKGAALSPPPDWTPLFAAAGLTLSTFHAVEPQWLPRSQSDVRAAWEGPFLDFPDATLRVEAASYRGRPIFFSVITPWTRPTREAPPPTLSVTTIVNTLSESIGLLVSLVALLLPRRHFRSGRGDRAGAFRTAVVVFVAVFAALLLRARHYAWLGVEWNRVSLMLGIALFTAVTFWLLYMAFEPYVRRFWPQLLIGWTRLLSGRVRDPLVGRDLLVGVAAGTVAAMLIASREIVPHLAGLPMPTPQLPPATILLGTRYALDAALGIVNRAMFNALQVVCIVALLKMLLRRTWIVVAASVVLILPIAMSGTSAGEQLGLEVGIALSGIALILAVLLRFGLLALVATFYTFMTMELFPLTVDVSRPYATASVIVTLSIAAVAAYGFYASRGDEPLFGRAILDGDVAGDGG
jgi:eukaryotic-like serine/threonine-protein kinase